MHHLLQYVHCDASGQMLEHTHTPEKPREDLLHIRVPFGGQVAVLGRERQHGKDVNEDINEDIQERRAWQGRRLQVDRDARKVVLNPLEQRLDCVV